MLCPRCPYDSFMQVQGDKIICPECSYQHDIPHKVPSQAELLKEVERLKETNYKLLEILTSHCAANQELEEALQEFISPTP